MRHTSSAACTPEAGRRGGGKVRREPAAPSLRSILLTAAGRASRGREGSLGPLSGFCLLVSVWCCGFLLFCFWPVPCGMRDLGSPTRNQTLALEALSLDQWTAREVPLFSASMSFTMLDTW